MSFFTLLEKKGNFGVFGEFFGEFGYCADFVPLINNQAARFNFGFASNLILLFWCVCGTFLLHMFESNYFTMLIKPTYEKPVDTAEDIIDRGLGVIYSPGSESIRETLLDSPFYSTRTLAERTTVPKVIISYIEKILFPY